MAKTAPDTAALLDDETEYDIEKQRDLRTIDHLIGRCQARMEGVSPGILSDATREATIKMYEELRAEAEDDALRAERVKWMEGNVQLLKDMIAKAAHERDFFEADLAKAVECNWINADDVPAWRATFEDPGQLEMHRSLWLKETWKKKYIAGWQLLQDDRARVLRRANAAGLTAADIPALATLASDALFLAKDNKFPARRSMVDTVDADIDGVARGKGVFLRQTEALLQPASKGADRFLHPAKVGAWLKRTMASENPERYRDKVLIPCLARWKAARQRYDSLAQQYEANGQPDGCAPMRVNAFLELSYDARMTTLREWSNRFMAAERIRNGETNLLEREKQNIRRAVDLHDFDTAEKRLKPLALAHPDDADIRTMTAHLALQRSREEKQEETVEESARTADALRELHAIERSVPTVLTSHYVHILESGDPEKAATFFHAMKLLGDRRDAGSIDDEALREKSETAAALEKTTVIDTNRDGTSADVIVTEGTQPSVTMTLLTEHRTADETRSPALVIEGVSFDQQRQLVEINRHALGHLRHLKSVGACYTRSSLSTLAA